MTPRWTFTRPGSTYTFEINPNQQTNPIRSRSITWAATRLGYSGTRAPVAPTPWSFSGVLRSQGQYDALVSWANCREKATLSTDLGQLFLIRLVKFTPEAGHRIQAPYRHTYTMDCLILSTAVSSSGSGSIADAQFTGSQFSVGGFSTPTPGGF